MSNDYKYPNRYSVYQALSEFCRRNFLDEFAQGKGIFITNVTQNELAQFLSSIFYDDNDLELIRKSALQPNGGNTLSGFRVMSDDIDLNLVNLLDEHRGKVVDKRNQMKIKAIINPKDAEPGIFQGSVDYVQQKPGRVEFLQGTERTFDYFLRRITGGLWEVLIDGSRSNDARILEDWLKRELPSGSEIQKIDQDLLTTTQTITFFDELGRCGATGEWRFSHVTRLILRRETSSTTPDDDEEELIEEASVLSGISQAILEGRELRNNSVTMQV